MSATALMQRPASEREYTTGETESAAPRPGNETPPSDCPPSGSRYNVLVLYDDANIHVKTTEDYLSSFRRFSRNNIFFANAVRDEVCPFKLDRFEAVVIHYTVRLCFDFLSRSFARKLRRFDGLKVLFVQDEYDVTNRTCRWIEKLGIDVVYTCVPPEYREQVYPTERFPGVRFEHTLTGFVPLHAERTAPPVPFSRRQRLIGYRGRALPPHYGSLGREKLLIGRQMKEICERRNLPVDIEWDETKRIYGDAWFEFLRTSRATLGTESGSNVFDFDGSIAKAVRKELKRHPSLPYDVLYGKHLREHDGRIRMNQISPKIFEAIANHTALVLFEGSYSGVVEPHVHYIPLKKDFSNVDEVLAMLDDDALLEAMTQRAYRDVIESGRYSYRRFIGEFDKLLKEELGERDCAVPLITLYGFCEPGQPYMAVVKPVFGLLPTEQLVPWHRRGGTIRESWWVTARRLANWRRVPRILWWRTKQFLDWSLHPRRYAARGYRLWKLLPESFQKKLRPVSDAAVACLRKLNLVQEAPGQGEG